MKSNFILCLSAMGLLASGCAKTSFTDPAAAAVSNSTAKTSIALVSPPGDVVGKVAVGYQGWFAAQGDGSPFGGWWHWPGSVDPNYKAWPDMRQYAAGYQSVYAALNNGQASKLFSDWDQSTINTQFLWMQQNGLDCAALQRFNPNSPEGPIRDGITTKVRAAAESFGRKFYIMYDVSGWTNMQSEIKTDWTSKMSANTSSSAYAKQNGKPVVCIWGFGFNDANHNFTAAACQDVINFFKGQGCYVIGGVPREWRTGVGGSRSGFLSVYHSLNMISPWLIGAIGSVTDADNVYNQFMVPDESDCQANGIDYQPCVLPGDLSGHQRAHGDLFWRNFYNTTRAGAQGLYISMFDEYGEGNQIAATAETHASVPSGTNIPALDEDGTACSADYYLRVSGDGAKMFRQQIGLTSTRPTPPTLTGPVSLTPQAMSGATIRIFYSAVTGAPCYNLKRSTTSGGPYTTVATITGGGFFDNSGLTPGTRYYYVVTAGHINGGESGLSPQVSAVALP
ncbi:MAG TPA: glycoside hydrolase family 71/99-like protein [Puia sp.]|nr:glycoside hydrolase family 71/99-like protein [Puia sp.]